METAEKKPLLEHFADLEDPRTRQSRHDLKELLLVAVCAVLSGADGWAAVALWGRAKLPWLRRFLPFENGVASHDTFGRVFALLDAAGFEERFIAWMGGVCGALAGLQVAIDGKTAKRSKSAGGKALHLVSAYAHGLGLALGQVRTAEKSNEITAIPELLDALLLRGCVVTLDAMGCQKAIAAKIVGQEADYVLSVKNNQPGLAAALDGFFDEGGRDGWEGRPHTHAEWVEKDHGRIETRRCVVAEDVDGRVDRADWPGVRTLAMVEAIREVGGTTSRERRYYISSLSVDAARMGEIVRGHWGVENGLHWSLDIAFGEDQARMREGNSAENFSILRRIALNLLRQDKTTKAGIKNRRLLAGWNDEYRQHILGIQTLA
ncbi:Predicted transposase YbfD/YdcC associated with H repeats [Methylomagnum ishizawai]|uniref:Predicted transposase YbfD/YdcC associated with H repeats n=1 Tax=Methylomagnum ishizawai TaxID=1760988 RepID=A0A1Y6CXU3_9GAMM|nr:ISAs1 family transposase [Methylomagnum ishizawai]SMF94177.1 Predicted transposase YbfD/YdcC associated with H repeats [Methylomagnum ishizawai]SMF95106.1 Predicted transposase YbfD/YdcC associated with H repeats [Methylomagnum ishizawai]SMF97053.1 Predicted transposase YbfD/YdcC associated with H repeats [Methylomagnum ishizawai]SMF97591.1 Predicted transposase YbfD/YdcC associated with H repeats [Methylomagnum ishizawai]